MNEFKLRNVLKFLFYKKSEHLKNIDASLNAKRKGT